MSVKPRDLGMTPLDDLFSTDESRAEAQLEKVIKLNPAEISDFPNHPFKVKQDDDMAEMVESIKKYGVLVPALVRPKEDAVYGGGRDNYGKRGGIAADLYPRPKGRKAESFAIAKGEPLRHPRRRISAPPRDRP